MGTWTSVDIPSQSGRTAIVTGANTGLGFEIADALAASGAHVVIAVRNVAKGKDAAARIETAQAGAQVSVQHLDLASLTSVRTAANELRAAHKNIDLLINNAGVAAGFERGITEDGFELQFGTNHLGHFALTGLVLDRLLGTPGSRVVTMSSMGHLAGVMDFDDLQWERGYKFLAAYNRSKLANLLFTYDLQRRLSHHQTTIAVAAHPGASASDLTRNGPRLLRLPTKAISALLFQPTAMGALPALRAATDPNVLGGQYYGPGRWRGWRGHPVVVTSSERSHDEDAARRLWSVSEELTGVIYPT